MIVVMLIVFVVDILLLSATGQFLEGGVSPLRIVLGAFVGAVFAGVSLLQSFVFLHHFLWQLCYLVVISFLVFGISVRKWILFSLLHLSLGSISGGTREQISMLLGATGIAFACIVIGKGNRYVSVELSYGGRTVTLTALRDTGNTLRDPITGKQVLVIGADTAQTLTGLTTSQLADPVGSLGILQGLRLIPYQTVGNKGFLLALTMQNVKIGNKRGDTIVAFSPQVFNHRYQALTGGNV